MNFKKTYVPQNGYTPAQPYTVTFFENAHSRDNFDEGYITLWVQSGGADNPREVKLRHKQHNLIKEGVK